jgi:Antibiotic biosynthesis monooxygenase
MGRMLAFSRFRYDDDPTADGARELGLCLDRLAAQPGFVGGAVGRALDDPTLWVLHTRWENVGSYRRALSAYDIRMTVVPLLANALDEPSAYEMIAGDGATEPNDARSRLG